MPYKLTYVKFSQVPSHTKFICEGNWTWLKGTRSEDIHVPHNAYRTDYGTTQPETTTPWKVFEDDDIVQVQVLEV